MDKHRLLLAGDWIETGSWDQVLNPYDGSGVGLVAQGDIQTVDQAVRAAHEAFLSSNFPQYERASVLDRAADEVAQQRDDLADWN